MPCLHLDTISARGLGALRRWLKQTGGTLVSRNDSVSMGRAVREAVTA